MRRPAHGGGDAAAASGVSGVWAGHSTWGNFLELVRVWKAYDLHLSHPAVRQGFDLFSSSGGDSGARSETPRFGDAAAAAAARRAARAQLLGRVGAIRAAQPPGRVSWTFSSYPGIVSSTDDWYALDAGILVTETTTAAVNARSLARLSPLRGIPSWLRVSVANAVAYDAQSWAEAFRRGNSGTYNCGWLVLDAARAEELRMGGDAAASPADLAGWLLLVEQSPARVEVRDVTRDLLRDGVWASANRPFSHLVRKDLGYPADPPLAAAAHRTGGPAYFSASDGPRARILRREAPGVHDTASMLALMRLNRWRSDPESEGRPYVAVSARYDLALRGDPVRQPDGGGDAKAASVADVLALRSLGVVGPAYSLDAGAALPPFDWLGWVGEGFCGGAGGEPCSGAAAAAPASAPIPVLSLCSVARLPAAGMPLPVPVDGSGVVLPCHWDMDPAWLTLAVGAA